MNYRLYSGLLFFLLTCTLSLGACKTKASETADSETAQQTDGSAAGASSQAAVDSSGENPEQKKLAAVINGYEQRLRGQETIDRVLGDSIVANQLSYANQYPEAEHSPAYMYRAADISRGLGDYQKAVAIWTELYNKYPQHNLAPESLFMSAYTTDGLMKEKAKAKKLYEQFMKQYPQHNLAPQGKIFLDNLAKEGIK